MHLFTFKDSAGLEVLFAGEREGGGAFARGYSKVPLILKTCLLFVGHLKFLMPTGKQVKRGYHPVKDD